MEMSVDALADDITAGHAKLTHLKLVSVTSSPSRSMSVRRHCQTHDHMTTLAQRP